MSPDLRRDLLIGLLLLIVTIGLPFLVDSRYILGQVILLFFYVVIASQWNLLYGFAGIFSLAQLALFGFGAYVTAMLGYYLEWSVWLTFPVAGLATVLFSLLIGFACLRLTGAYVALLTLAIAQVMYVLIVTDTDCFRMEGMTCRQFTGGAVGFARFGDLGTREWLGRDWLLGNYYVVLALLVVTLIFTWAVIRSPMGLAFRALRDNPGYAMARGISRFKYQLLVFGLSAFFTGMAGGLYAAHFRAIGPSILSISLLLFLMAMAVVGGVGRFWGPVLGAALLMLADEFLREVGTYRTLGLGLVLLVFVVVLPDGLLGLFEKLRGRLAGRS
jgi:branched-chain amino acid transport system permease protein